MKERNILKVAIYSGSIPSTTFIERLITALAENGVEVLLHGQKTKPVYYESENIIISGFSGKFGKVWQALKYALFFLFTRPGQLNKLIRYYSKEVSFRSFLNWFVKVAPIVWYKPDVFHLQWVSNIESWLFLKNFEIKVVASLRGRLINVSPIADANLAKSYRISFPQVDGFHGVSNSIIEEAKKYGVSELKAKTVYSLIDINNLTFRDQKKDNSTLKILSVGRDHWKKGYKYALDAAKSLSDTNIDFHYTIIGGCGEEMLFHVNDLGLLENITLKENLSFGEVIEQMYDHNILLLPSVEEGIANVVLEAMALGTIVISTDCGGMKEVIKNGENGFLVPIRNPKAIKESLIYINSLTVEEKSEIRKNARLTIENQFNTHKQVEKMIDFYKDTLKSKCL